jgi:2-furoyl-CoA dehydrogenase large subunit
MPESSPSTRARPPLPGVACVLTGADARRLSGPIRPLIPTTAAVSDYCLAVDRARYVGEPVAAVAAVDRATAEDALERIAVEYEPLPPVVDAEEALKPGATLLYPELGTNVIWHDTAHLRRRGRGDGAGPRRAPRALHHPALCLDTARDLRRHGRLRRGHGQLRVLDQRSAAGAHHLDPGRLARRPQSRIRLSCPDIGGGFGNKRRPAYLLICALLARRAGRPVKFIEDRAENLTALMHACNGVMDVELAHAADGTLLALSVRDVTDEGKNLITPTQHNLIKLGNIANGYRIPAVRYEAWSVLTTKCPSGANRGIGKPFMCFAIERAMALLARRLGQDPAELRLRNYVTSAEMPYTTPPGAQYDSGDYPATLRRALECFDYAGWRAEQARARAQGRLLGIGIATSVEPAGTNLASYEILTGRRTASGSAEAAMVRMEPDGKVRASIGDPPAARATRLSSPRSWPTSSGSPRMRSASPAASTPPPRPGSICRATTRTSSPSPTPAPSWAPPAAWPTSSAASPRIAWRSTRATSMLRDGAAVAAGAPDRRIAFAELARTAYADVLGLPPEKSPGLEARHAHSNPLATPVDAQRRLRSQLVFANAAHCCLVEVHPRTGEVTVLKYLVVHDCGRELNPLIVEGMVHGSTVHGIGAALLEEFRYDAQGQFLTSTFMDYLKPTATDVPDIEVERLEHPSPFTPLGSKGVGEGGAIPGPAAVANAVEDALAPHGVTIRGLPITPPRVWEWMRSGAEAGAQPLKEH